MTKETKIAERQFSHDEMSHISGVLDLAERRVAERQTLRAELSFKERRQIDAKFAPYLGGKAQRENLLKVFGERIFKGKGSFREEYSTTQEAWCVRAMSFAKEIAERMRHKMDELGLNGDLEHPATTYITKDTLTKIIEVLEDIDSIALGWNYSPFDVAKVDKTAENPWSQEQVLRKEQSKNWKRSLLKHKKIGQFMGSRIALSWNAISDEDKRVDPLQIAVMMLLHDIGRSVTHDRFAHEHIQHIIFDAVGIPNEFISHYELNTEEVFLQVDFDAKAFVEKMGNENPQKILFHFCDIFSKTEDPINGTVLGQFSNSYLRQQARWYLEGKVDAQEVDRWITIFNLYPKPLETSDKNFIKKFFEIHPELQKNLTYYLNESKFVYEALEWFKRKGVELGPVHTATQEYINGVFGDGSTLPTSVVRV